MTHLVFATRGIWASMQQFITDLNAQRFWWERKDLTKSNPDGTPNPNYNKITHVPVQGILRPIQLWEYVVPETSPSEPGKLDCPKIDNAQMMLRSFDIKGPMHYEPRSIDWGVNYARNKLGLKPIPDVNPDGPMRSIHLLGISIVPIGLKNDEFRIHDFGPAGKYEQEGL